VRQGDGHEGLCWGASADAAIRCELPAVARAVPVGLCAFLSRGDATATMSTRRVERDEASLPRLPIEGQEPLAERLCPEPRLGAQRSFGDHCLGSKPGKAPFFLLNGDRRSVQDEAHPAPLELLPPGLDDAFARTTVDPARLDAVGVFDHVVAQGVGGEGRAHLVPPRVREVPDVGNEQKPSHATRNARAL